MPKRHTQDLKSQAGKLYGEGRTYSDVASALGVGAMSVWRWVREAGLPKRSSSEAAKASPRVKLGQEKCVVAAKQAYCGSDRHLANLAKIRTTPRFKEAATKKLRLDEEIVVYCSDDMCSSSQIAADRMERAGFTRILHYKGGLKDWSAAGYPLEGSMVRT